MSSGNYTPGPWSVKANNCYFEVSSEHGFIGDVCMSGHEFDSGNCLGPTAEANAKLIAAAPELLEALLRVRAQFSQAGFSPVPGSLNPVEDNFAFINAVINKALGESQ